MAGFTLQGFVTNLRKTPMNQRVDVPAAAIDFNDEDSNTSANPTFGAVLLLPGCRAGVCCAARGYRRHGHAGWFWCERLWRR